MVGIEIRDARPEDRPVMEAFMAALQDYERALGADLPPGAEMAAPHLDVLLGSVAAHPAGCVLIAWEGERALGMVIAFADIDQSHYLHERDRQQGHISDLWVEEDARDRGIGAALIAAAEERMRAAGLQAMSVSALTENAGAHRLYRRIGYRETHRLFFRRL